MSKSKDLLDSLQDLPVTQRKILVVKPADPWGFKSQSSRNSLFDRLEPYADIIGIYTDPLYDGGYDWLKTVCSHTPKPVVALGSHPTKGHVQHCLDVGAAHVVTLEWHEYLCDITRQPPEQLSTIWHHRLSKAASMYCEPWMTFIWDRRCTRYGNKQKNWINGLTIGMGLNVKRYSEPLRHHSQLPVAGAKLLQAGFISDISDVHPDVDGYMIGEAICE